MKMYLRKDRKHYRGRRGGKTERASEQRGRGNRGRHKYRLAGKRIESSPEEKDLGVLVDKKLNMTPQRVLKAQKTNHTQGCTKSSVISRSRERILPLYSALVRPHLESCILWSPQHRERHGAVGAGPEEGHKNDEVFKATLDGALSNLVQWKVSLPVAGDLEFDDLEAPFNPNHSMII